MNQYDNQANDHAIDFATLESKREPLCDAGILYQSRAFESKAAINPLVGASAPLLTIATELLKQRQPPELIPLHDALCHEIKVFENKARENGYRSSTILAGRYFLCAFIDETILSTEWGANSRWAEYNLLTTFQREAVGDERFFLILERCLEDPSLHIDLLELGYLCLNLGYQGKWRKKLSGAQEIGLWLDKLYDSIQAHRGEFSRCLLIAPTIPTPTITKRFRLLPHVIAIGVAAMILSGLYVTDRLQLTHLAQQIQSSIDAHA